MDTFAYIDLYKMEKLKVLDHPQLTNNILKTLAHNKIITILEFVHAEVEKLSAITKLTLPQILEIRNEIFMKFSAPVLDGYSFFEKMKACETCIKTGIQSLDTLLSGGLPVGYITELCGLPHSGKTQLCFQIALNCVREINKTVIFIDTKGDFSASRIKNVLEDLGCSYQEMAQILYKIKVIAVWTMEELLEIIRKIRDQTIAFESLALIIIDSLPCLMFQHLGDDSKIGLTFLNNFVNHCRFIAKNFNVGVVCVNIQTRWVQQDIPDAEDSADGNSIKELPYTEKYNRCLGKYWHYIPAVVLQMEKLKLEDYSKNHVSLLVKVTTIKTNAMKSGQTCVLNITSSGVT